MWIWNSPWLVNKGYDYLRAQIITLWESVFFVNLNWLFPRQCLLVMLPKRLVNTPAKLLSQLTPSICTRFQNIQNLEVKPLLKLKTIKKCKFCISPMEKFTITIIGKTILRSDVHAIEKLHKTEQIKIESILLMNANFLLIQ